MDAFQLPKELEVWRTDMARLAQEVVAPLADEMDETDQTPAELATAFADAGLFATVFPVEYAGSGADMLRFVLAVEEIARVSAAAALMLAIQALGAFPLEVAGSDQQKARWFPELASGGSLAAFALTEPEAGSDVAALMTRAEAVPGGWVISGFKHY